VPQPLLFVLCGPPFSGKSTVARAMASRFSIALIEIDGVHRERELEAVEVRDWQIAFQRAFRRLHRSLSAGQSVVWDAASLTRAQRDRIRSTGVRYGADIQLIYVDTPYEERVRRRNANLITHARVDVPIEEFDAASSHFEVPSADEHPIRMSNQDRVEAWLDQTIAPRLRAAEGKH
jgi:predicted kinase